MKNVPGKTCPIKVGYLFLDERAECDRYLDDCEVCDDWADERQNTVSDKEKGDYPYQGIAPKIQRGLL
jgi:hypothetical protein